MGLASIRTILVIVCLASGTAFAGFEDFAGSTGGTKPQQGSTNSLVNESEMQLALDLGDESQSQIEQFAPVRQIPMDMTPPPPAVTAPLPPAVMSGAALLILAKVIKRRMK